MKYKPLTEYLRNLPANTKNLNLTFRQLEEILGAKLPRSARTYQEWWANQLSGSQGPSWLNAGFIIDSVSIERSQVRFRRAAVTAPKPRERSGPRPQAQASPKDRNARIGEEVLLKAGFSRVGTWMLEGGELRLSGNLPDEPGVYAHVVDGVVHYIGVARMGLRRRLYFYERPGRTQLTNQRINPLIRQAIEAGRQVWVIVATPGQTEWNGLPVDISPGLEAGLLAKGKPPWNK